VEEKVHPSNSRGCRHAKAQLQIKKSQKTPKTTTGRVFPTKMTTLTVSFAKALRGRADQQQPAAQQVVLAALGAPTVNSSPLDNMLRDVTIVQQSMIELSGAVSEEQKIMAITKIV
jgi:hypothetical protein